MLPFANRLKKEKQIARARAGRRRGDRGLLVCRAAANDLGVARFCFVVSKKVSKKAVVRNKVKRRLRAAVAGLMDRILPGFDCVLAARPGLEIKTWQEINMLAESVLISAGLMNLKIKNEKVKTTFKN